MKELTPIERKYYKLSLDIENLLILSRDDTYTDSEFNALMLEKFKQRSKVLEEILELEKDGK